MTDSFHFLVDEDGHLTPDGVVPARIRKGSEFASTHFHTLQEVLAEARKHPSLTQYLASLCKEIMGSLPEGWTDEPEAIVRDWFLVVGGEQEKFIIREANKWAGEKADASSGVEELADNDDGTAVAVAYFLHETVSAEALKIEITGEDEAGSNGQMVVLKCSIEEANGLAEQHGLPVRFKSK